MTQRPSILEAAQEIRFYRVLKGHGFTACVKTPFGIGLYQGTTSVVPKRPLFLSFLADFSPQGICFCEFFISLFSRAVQALNFCQSSRTLVRGESAFPSFSSTSLAACILLVGISLAGCGTPGAPQLPSLQLARPVDDLTASRKGSKVQLDWTLPRKNTDRTLVRNIPQSLVCRHDGTALMSGCTMVATVQNPKIEAKRKGEDVTAVRMQYVDTLPPQLGEQDPAGFVRYAVEILNSRERSAGLSNQVLIPVAPTIAPPEQLTAKVEADGVLLEWEAGDVPTPPAGLTYRYRVTRSPAGANAYIALADLEPESEGFYLDKTFGWETKYDYRITSVTLVHSQNIDMAVEGDDSKSTEIFTRDIYPPAQPTGLQAVFSSVGQKPFVDLTWAPNMDSDLAGYNLFRRVGDGDPVKLNKQLLPVPSFRDDQVVPGKTYLYSVSAVDARGNESPHSAETIESVPDKQ
jgi:hypothetical protein